MPKGLLSQPRAGLSAWTGALLLLTGNPVLATDSSHVGTLASAEQCRQLAIMEKLNSTAAIPTCEQAVKKNPKNAELKVYFCRALLNQAEREKMALKMCQQAAEAGNLEGMLTLGEYYDTLSELGIAAKSNAAKAVAWYRRAAEKGFAPAQNNLGAMYDAGTGVEKNDQQAVFWFRKAAEQGYPMAQVNLGDEYRTGSGVEKDSAQAIAWYRKATEQGYAQAYLRLGEMYKDGDGIDKDIPQAIDWYQKCLKNSDSDTKERAVDDLIKLMDIEYRSKDIDPNKVAPILVVALQDQNEELRRKVAEVLSYLNTWENIPILVEALRYGDDSSQERVAETLGKFGVQDTVPALIEQSRNPDRSVRYAVAEALVNIGSREAIPALLAALQDEYEGVRWTAASGLGALGAKEAIPGLIQALQDDSSENVRWSAAEALGQLDAREATPALIQALQDGEVRVRRQATETLGGLGGQEAAPALIAALLDQDADVKEAAAEALGKIGNPDAIAALITALQDDSALVQSYATTALGQLDNHKVASALIEAIWGKDQALGVKAMGALARVFRQEAVSTLIDACHHHENADLRVEAASWLDEIPLNERSTREVIPALMQALQDAEAQVRKSAAFSLGRLGAKEAVPALKTLLLDQDDRVKLGAIEALRRLGDQEVVPSLAKVLMSLLQSEGRDVKFIAIDKLGELGAQEAVPFLIQALQDREELVRSSAATALGRMGVQEAVPALIEMLRDQDFSVGKSAAQALARIGGQKAVSSLIAALEEDVPAVVSLPSGWLNRLSGQEAIPTLVEALRKGDSWVKENAIEALGNLHRQETVPYLLAALRNEDQFLSWSAAKELEKRNVKQKDVPYALAAIIESDSQALRRSAAEALGNFNASKETVSALFETLRDKDEKVRQNAATALGAQQAIALLTLLQIAEQGRELAPAIHKTANYSPELMFLVHTATVERVIRNRLAVLSSLWHHESFSNTLLSSVTLQTDLAQLDREATPAGAVSRNPYVLYFIARVLAEQGQDAEALPWVDRGLGLVDAQNPVLQLLLRWIRAEALWKTGRPEAALTELEGIDHQLLPQLMPLEYTALDLDFTAYTRTLKGRVLGAVGRSREAVEAFNAAEDALNSSERRDLITKEVAQRQRYHLTSFRSQAALVQARQDADAARQLGENLPLRSRLDQDATEAYLISSLKLALAAGETEQAHVWTEKLILLRQKQLVPGRLASASPERQAVLQDLQIRQQQLATLDEQLKTTQQAKTSKTGTGQEETTVSRTGKDLETLERERKAARSRLKEFVTQLKQNHPDWAALVMAEPADLATIQAALQPDQALLQYVLLPEQGWLFLVTGDDMISLDLGVGRQQLAPLIQQYRWQLQTPAATRGFTLDPTSVQRAVTVDAPRELSRRLLQPALDKLTNQRRLIIVPNGDLHFLPFAALPVDGHYLIERFTLSTLSSASLLARTRPATVPPHPRLLALANPVQTGLDPLPGAEAEVQAIGAHYPDPDKRLYFREHAQRSVLVGHDLRGWTLHLAVHGQAGAMNTTRLRLSDGDLTLADVWNLYLDDAPMVVLSACQTALGEHLSGDEVVSLANGFLFAGARTLIATLWPVPDEPTRRLMEAFYDSFPGDPSVALAQAQRAQIQAGRDPYDWAGFVVGGW